MRWPKPRIYRRLDGKETVRVSVTLSLSPRLYQRLIEYMRDNDINTLSGALRRLIEECIGGDAVENGEG